MARVTRIRPNRGCRLVAPNYERAQQRILAGTAGGMANAARCLGDITGRSVLDLGCGNEQAWMDKYLGILIFVLRPLLDHWVPKNHRGPQSE